jgi:sugar phosphate isomerase/epimerase
MAVMSGLVSVTFRQLDVEAIVELAAKAGIDGIEWGGDVHVKPGDDDAADQARELCESHGLAIPSYGSYLRLGHTSTDEMLQVLDTAEQLGAANVRVWPGKQGSAESDEAYRNLVAKDFERLGELAYGRDLTVSVEYHGNSLTDTAASTLALLRQADHPSLHTYWQPRVGLEFSALLDDLDTVLYDLLHVHVYQWKSTSKGLDRRPLAEGEELWRAVFKALRTEDRDRYAFLEFVAGDDPDAFLADARTLRDWLDT